MSVFLAWFDQRPGPARAAEHGLRRARFAVAAAGLTPAGYRRHDSGGADWGLAVRHAPDPGRWPVYAAGDGLTAVSLGLPVGLDTTGGALGVARRLLAGADLAAEAVPPFGMLVHASAGCVLVAQDWLGMCRIYTATHDGVVAFGNRASLLAAFLHGAPAPDTDGWESCAAGGVFGGDTAPVRGVRLLGPAARVRLRRTPHGWRAAWRAGRGVDNLVQAGLSRRGDPDRAVAVAADGLAAAVTAAATLCGDGLTFTWGADPHDRVVAA
ncbi:MAG TPA: hypothetical protein VFY17_08580, partial [Pilimelia sp.]|nr:hypothetical protein [Pilimelia sp.]